MAQRGNIDWDQIQPLPSGMGAGVTLYDANNRPIKGPSLPSDATKYLDGTGAFSVPAGSSSVLTTKGDLLTYGTAIARLGVGTDGYVLTARSSATNGIDWEAGGGGGGALPSGAVFTATNDLAGSNGGWQNFSLAVILRGCQMYSFPGSGGWKIRMLFTAGSPVIGNMVILRTANYSATVIDSTAVKIGGTSSPTLTTPSLVETDTISLALDKTHDYCFVIFFANNGANASVAVSQTTSGTAGALATADPGGDQTGATSIGGFGFSHSGLLVLGGIMA